MNAETPHVDLCGSGTGSPLRYTTTGVPQIAATPKSAESGQTRPRRPPPRHAYARPMLPSKRTHMGRPDRGSLGPLPDIQPETTLDERILRLLRSHRYNFLALLGCEMSSRIWPAQRKTFRVRTTSRISRMRSHCSASDMRRACADGLSYWRSYGFTISVPIIRAMPSQNRTGSRRLARHRARRRTPWNESHAVMVPSLN